MNTEFTNGLTQLIREVSELCAAALDRVETGAGAVAGEMEAVAKRDAPWTDRTGNARRTLTGYTGWENADTLIVGLCGMMPYSPSLELRHGGRYAIILPVVDSYAPNIVTTVAQAVWLKGGLADE